MAKRDLSKRLFEVEIIITRKVTVQLSEEDLGDTWEGFEAAAEEMAMDGIGVWPDNVVDETQDYDVEGIAELLPKAA